MSKLLETQIAAAEQEWLKGFKQGPTRIRWTQVPLQVGDQAPDFELQDMTGQPVHLQAFWQDGPALLLFWRHYGCSCGIERVRRLKQEYEHYLKLGVTVISIGQGEPERAALYAQTHGLPCRMLCDPTYHVYEAYDLLEGQASQILFDTSDDLLRCESEAAVKLAEGRHGTPRALVDSPWQLPGEFVVDRSGIIRLAYRYQYCEDWPNPLVLIAALREAAGQL